MDWPLPPRWRELIASCLAAAPQARPASAAAVARALAAGLPAPSASRSQPPQPEEAGKWIRGITVKALETLVRYAWPGNVRELEHEVRLLVQRCPEGSAIDSSMLSEVIHRAGDALPEAHEDDSESLELQQATDRLERRLIGWALERSGGNRSNAAKLLGISRNGLAEKMERLGIALRTAPATTGKPAKID
ncbi:MAG TPA: helix-turn-helix domain-containing protein [Thermoanaerobaculia bacterium]|nr:helix-turn-helix domain-containing protein [Thermoanaerobaculia bacterium]